MFACRHHCIYVSSAISIICMLNTKINYVKEPYHHPPPTQLVGLSCEP